jgi:hypothetical protein
MSDTLITSPMSDTLTKNSASWSCIVRHSNDWHEIALSQVTYLAPAAVQIPNE